MMPDCLMALQADIVHVDKEGGKQKKGLSGLERRWARACPPAQQANASGKLVANARLNSHSNTLDSHLVSAHEAAKNPTQCRGTTVTSTVCHYRRKVVPDASPRCTQEGHISRVESWRADNQRLVGKSSHQLLPKHFLMRKNTRCSGCIRMQCSPGPRTTLDASARSKMF